ncbi:hypothetical protein AB1Y20_002531 [Prymnesium parvum]|uniref:Uncharacterized protein n=1 Tax=Prymnesium parvum TaxID=97485 RepID=A0AB34J8W0_PRYPA
MLRLPRACSKLRRRLPACPARLLFKRPRWQGDGEYSAWNEWTFILFALYLTTVPSRKTREPLAIKSVETYIALLKGHLSVEYEFELMHRTPRLRRLLARLREADPRSAVVVLHATHAASEKAPRGATGAAVHGSLGDTQTDIVLSTAASLALVPLAM